MNREAWWVTVHGVLRVRHNWSELAQHSTSGKIICKRISIYLQLNHFAVCLKLTWQCQSNTFQWKIRKKDKASAQFSTWNEPISHIHCGSWQPLPRATQALRSPLHTTASCPGVRGEAWGPEWGGLRPQLWLWQEKDPCLSAVPTAKLPVSSSCPGGGQECSNTKLYTLKANLINHPQQPPTGGTGLETEVILAGGNRENVEPSCLPEAGWLKLVHSTADKPEVAFVTEDSMGTYFPLLIWQGMEQGVGGPSFQRGKQNYPVFFFFFPGKAFLGSLLQQ